jgi:hypothetical protein
LLAYLAQVPDPRGLQGRRHPLSAMLAAVVCAVLCGARGYRAIAQWARLQEPETWHDLGFTRRPPCANCFRDLLIVLAPEEFERVLQQWVNQLPGLQATPETLRPTSIDGKTLCGALQSHGRAIHLLAALDQQTGAVLSQTEVGAKTNEAKAALKLLKDLVLKGRVIVGDAMFCQREICQEILTAQGHYLFVVKENQPTLLREIEAAFVNEAAFSPLGGPPISRGTPDSRDVGQRARSRRTPTTDDHHHRQ